MSRAPRQKSGHLSSADKLRKKINDEKEAAEHKKQVCDWTEQLAVLKKKNFPEQLDYLGRWERNKDLCTSFLATELRLYQLHLQFLLWIHDTDGESDAARDRYTVAIIRLVKDIADRKNVTPTVSKVLSSILVALGFSDYVPTMASPTLDEKFDKPIHFDFVKIVKSKTNSPMYKFMKIREHPVVWQMRLFGEYMDRSMDSQPDRRVKFEPDAWQRKVLDAIDDNSSLLVVGQCPSQVPSVWLLNYLFLAPTSAGKTFISFYAMEKVLRESDDGIIVYVAPTKALVTQIAAEIYARFRKDLKEGSCILLCTHFCA
jgi:superfamily II RNA helicase